jgi:hypothetical protein
MARHSKLPQVPTENIIQARLESAVNKLLRRDIDLLGLDVNERAITHRLAMYLQEEFPGWDVDCEYNRNHDQVKQLRFPEGQCRPDDTNAKTVFPDVIVHTRNTGQNLLVIEVKKDSNNEGEEYDLEKLHAFKSELAYSSAAFIKFRTRQNPGAQPIRWL